LHSNIIKDFVELTEEEVSILVLMDLAFEFSIEKQDLQLKDVSILVLMDLAFESRSWTNRGSK